jgi:hypothetical protein
VGASILHTHEYRVRDFGRSWRPLLAADVGDDYGTVTDFELGAVVLTDPQTLLESKRLAEPSDRLAHVRIDEDRDDNRRWDRAVRFSRLPPVR